MYPNLLKIGKFTIHSYGLMSAFAFLAAIWWTIRFQSKDNPAIKESFSDLSIIGMISILIFSRAIYIITNLSYYIKDPIGIFKIYNGGLSMHGGILGGIIACLIYCRLKKINFWTVVDIASPGVALGTAIGRIGCWLGGCCYGIQSSLPWSLTNPYLQDSIRRHPTQLYESFALIIIFFSLISIKNRYKDKINLLILFILLYSFFRVIIEQFRRGTEPVGSSLPSPFYLTYAQIVSIIVIITCIIIFSVQYGKQRKNFYSNSPRR